MGELQKRKQEGAVRMPYLYEHLLGQIFKHKREVSESEARRIIGTHNKIPKKKARIIFLELTKLNAVDWQKGWRLKLRR